jgi:hypothetical protein
MSRPAHLGLDEHVRPDGHEASSQAAPPMVAIYIISFRMENKHFSGMGSMTNYG